MKKCWIKIENKYPLLRTREWKKGCVIEVDMSLVQHEPESYLVKYRNNGMTVKTTVKKDQVSFKKPEELKWNSTPAKKESRKFGWFFAFLTFFAIFFLFANFNESDSKIIYPIMVISITTLLISLSNIFDRVGQSLADQKEILRLLKEQKDDKSISN